MIDERGFPGAMGLKGEFDGGDTAAIIGNILACDKYSPMIGKIPALIRDGVPVRHPDTTKWYGQRDRFSRDQLIPIICAAVVTGNRRFDAFYTAHKRRWFLTAWNTRKNGVIETPTKFPDICGPEIWALWIRFKNPWWMYWVLWILDFELLFSAIKWRLFPRSNVTRNHLLSSMICIRYSPTWVSMWVNSINNWWDLVHRWHDHITAANEYDTFTLFDLALGGDDE